jgi:2-methylfumaryl-CoA hydratase
MTGNKATAGRFFEDFTLGEVIEHATPRTVTEGDIALYIALTGTRFVLNSSEAFAMSLGLPQAPLDDWLVFHMVFGKTVPDISQNAVANLGYASGRFLTPVYAGDTLNARSEVIGLKQNSSGDTGTVYVRSTGFNHLGDVVLEYCRWVMVRKRDQGAPAPTPVVPDLPEAVAASDLMVPEDLVLDDYDPVLAGSPHLWDDYGVGERIDHIDGITIEEAEHALATRLYQNTARVHFNQHTESQGRFGRRLIYGGHIISLARALSFNGLGNTFRIAALNGGRHVAPAFAGDTVYAWSEVVDKAPIEGRDDVGALRVRLTATKDRNCAGFPGRTTGGFDPAVILELDTWMLIPR